MDTQRSIRNAGAVLMGGGGLVVENWLGAFSGLVQIESRDSLFMVHCEDIYRRHPFGL
jgi:hypothetical protein